MSLDFRDRRLHLSLLGIGALAWGLPLTFNLALRLRFEDAMIVLRYARNILEGQGFVFNPGERVLGVTTPLQTLLSVVFVACGGDAAPAWQNVAGLLFLVVEAFLVLLILHELGYRALALPAALLTLGNFQLSYLYLGMESHLFAAAILLCSWLELRGVSSRTLGFCLGLAFLVRYDAALLAGLIGVGHWVRERRLPLRLLGFFLIPVLPWLAFAFFYFGSILPGPLGAKEGFVAFGPYLDRVHQIYHVVFEQICALFSRIDRLNFWVGRTWPLLLVGAAALAAFRHPRFRALAPYPFLHVVIYAAIGSDPGFTWHFYWLNPFFFVLFAVLLSEFCSSAWSFLATRFAPLRRPWHLVTLGLLVAGSLVPITRHLVAQATFRFELDPHSAQLVEIGRYLRATYPPETSLLQGAIGFLGWESGLRLVDWAGLVTPGLYFFHDLDCTPVAEVVARHRPDLILLSQWSSAEVESLGYRKAHVFVQPFEYRLYERTP
jgi:hypothetical protein